MRACGRAIGEIMRGLLEGILSRVGQSDKLPLSGTDARQALRYLDQNREALRASWDRAGGGFGDCARERAEWLITSTPQSLEQEIARDEGGEP